MKTATVAAFVCLTNLVATAAVADVKPGRSSVAAPPARSVGAYGYGAQNSSDEAHPVTPASTGRDGSTFACDGDRSLRTRFESRRSVSVAVVDAGDGPHALPLLPWDGAEPRITWSDGRRTLEWTSGVKLMWMDGPAHLACGRAEHHH